MLLLMPERTRKMNNLIAVRLDDGQLARLNSWRKKQDDPPTRAEAIRKLMERGLDVEENEKTAKESRRRA
jgi:hypothetical protein